MKFCFARCAKWDIDYSMESDPSHRLRSVIINEKELNKFLAREDVVIYSMRIFYKYA